METMKILRLGVIIFLCKVFLCEYAEESSCTPGFETELLVFKVHRDDLHQGTILGRVIFNTCDGRTRTLFQSSDKWFDVDTDGTVTLKRQVTLHEGHKVFSVHAWDSSGKKHTVSVRVERVHHHGDHHMDPVMNISSPQMECPSDDLVLTFPKSSGLRRARSSYIGRPVIRHPFKIKLAQHTVPENKVGAVVATVTVIESPPWSTKYRIISGDKDGFFNVRTGASQLEGIITTVKPLDFEKNKQYILSVIVENDDPFIYSYVTSTATVTVNVEDVNEPPEFTPEEKVIYKPEDSPVDSELVTYIATDPTTRKTEKISVFPQNSFNGNVPEAAVKGHDFMTVTATDADDPKTENGMIRYSIVKQEPELPKPNMFQINSITGEIYVNSFGLDREKWSKYTLTVVAADLKGKGHRITGTAVITVTDSNDNAPQFEQTSHTVSVPENKVGAEVAKLTVTDGDEVGSPAWSTKYRIISGDKSGFFNISTGPSRLEGIITTVKPLDFEKNKQYILSVIVENDDPFVGSLATSTATVTVNVEDVNEPPEFNPEEKVIYKPVDSELVSYTAIDPDVGLEDTFCLQ